MPTGESSPSTSTTASLLRASGEDDLASARAMAYALLAAECLKAEVERLQDENRQLRADRDRYKQVWELAEDHVALLAKTARDTTGQEAHADLLRLLDVVPEHMPHWPTYAPFIASLRAKWIGGER